VLGPDERQSLVDARPDLRRLDAGVLETERDLVHNPAHHDLVLGILKDGGDDARELRRTSLACVDPAHDHAPAEDAAVEMRDEPGERAQKGRLPRAGGAEQQHVLTVGELE
jgi:hypothetical protein